MNKKIVLCLPHRLALPVKSMGGDFCYIKCLPSLDLSPIPDDSDFWGMGIDAIRLAVLKNNQDRNEIAVSQIIVIGGLDMLPTDLLTSYQERRQRYWLKGLTDRACPVNDKDIRARYLKEINRISFSSKMDNDELFNKVPWSNDKKLFTQG